MLSPNVACSCMFLGELVHILVVVKTAKTLISVRYTAQAELSHQQTTQQLARPSGVATNFHVQAV